MEKNNGIGVGGFDRGGVAAQTVIVSAGQGKLDRNQLRRKSKRQTDTFACGEVWSGTLEERHTPVKMLDFNKQAVGAVADVILWKWEDDWIQ